MLKISNGDISVTGHPIHFMFRTSVGFSGRQIERRYFWFNQVQDGGQPPLKIPNDDYMYLWNGSPKQS